MVKFDGTLLTGLAIGMAFVTTGGAVAGFGMTSGHAARYADVVEVRPVTRTVRVPREVCVRIEGAQRDATQPAGTARATGEAKGNRQRCRTVDEDEARVVAYDVSYQIGDSVEVVRLRHAPGSRLLLRNGRVELEPAIPGAASAGAPASG